MSTGRWQSARHKFGPLKDAPASLLDEQAAFYRKHRNAAEKIRAAMLAAGCTEGVAATPGTERPVRVCLQAESPQQSNMSWYAE